MLHTTECAHRGALGYPRPRLTPRFTVVPLARTAPPPGLCESTRPFLTFLEYAYVRRPTRQLARASVRAAILNVLPRSYWTSHAPGLSSLTQTSQSLFRSSSVEYATSGLPSPFRSPIWPITSGAPSPFRLRASKPVLESAGSK